MQKIDIIPDLSNPSVYIPLLIIPIAVQWWAVWYPGAEPGGGGYIAQKMLSAKDEKNAIGATLLFNFMHYAIRPWPWIVVALASLIIFPDLASIKAEFPGIEDKYVGHDVAYPAMLTRLGPGWLGLVVASLIAAYMSTIGTHLNWGSSYVVNDFYKRFIKPDASEKQLVGVGRITTVLLMVVNAIFALTFLENATQAFDILLLSGAGTGLIYLLRWFWWRINAMTEIVAMVVATILAVILVLYVDDATVATEVLDGFTMKLLLTVSVVTVSWLATAFLSKPDNTETLRKFYKLTRPGGPGWKKIVDEARADGDPVDEKEHGLAWEMPLQILLVFLGCVVIYCCLFSIGGFVYGEIARGFILLGVSGVATYFLFKVLAKLRVD